MNLLDNITDNTVGILWLTKNQISKETKYFDQLDYIVNGQLLILLKNSLENKTEQQTSNMFITNSFNSSIFLYQETLLDDSTTDLADKIKMLANKTYGEKDYILLINDSGKQVTDSLKQKITNIALRDLNLQ